MQVVQSISDLRALRSKLEGTVGFVPTMGYLHAGHLALVERAGAENAAVIVSIYVNPTQFGPREDFAAYPRDLDRDLRLLREAGADIVFAPGPGEMYAADFTTYVEETELSKGLCGRSRPTHFRGVTTVVAKLLNIVQPDRVYFGQKDAQQAAVVKRMVRDLDIPVEVVVMPTVREADGLAMSSRNAYLSPAQRGEALVLSTGLAEARRLFEAGERSASVLKKAISKVISAAPGAKIDYIEVVDAETLENVKEIRRPALVAMAVLVGKTRLIDNVVLKP